MNLRQREPRLEIPAFLEAARDEQCTIRHPRFCINGTQTTVAAHSNWGKGVGMKDDDTMIAFACWGCHNWLDTTRDADRIELFLRGHKRTLRRLVERGILTWRTS